jgi:conjugal transfer pilus assembly protein TraW
VKKFNTLVVAMLSLFAVTCALRAGTVEDQARGALALIKKNPHLRRAESEVKGLDRVIRKRLLEGKSLLDAPRIRKEKPRSPCREKYYLFISSSIPIDTIRAYVVDARRIRQKGICVDFVLRGFLKGGKYLYRTIDWYLLFALKNPDRPLSQANPPVVWIQIDPTLAKAAGVTMVPALVSDDGSCTVYGDAELSYLIQMLRERRCGQVAGKTYAFAEKNALDQIEELARSFDWKSYQKEQKKKLLTLAEERLRHFFCPGFSHARSDRTYAVKPVYELEFDIPDPQHPGRILYPRGFRYNVLEYAPFQGSIILIDASRKSELSALAQIIDRAPKPVRVLLVGGDYVALFKRYSKRNDVFVYADCRAAERLVRLYGVCRGGTPCVVRAEGKRFVVREISATQASQSRTQGSP